LKRLPAFRCAEDVMNSASQFHSQGVSLFEVGRYQEALDAFRKALSESASSELWNDWAAAQFALGFADEAEAGFQLALDSDAVAPEAAANLAALRAALGKKSQSGAVAADDEKILSELLFRLPADPNERSYFKMHQRRYLETLKLLPNAEPGQRLLEL